MARLICTNHSRRSQVSLDEKAGVVRILHREDGTRCNDANATVRFKGFRPLDPEQIVFSNNRPVLQAEKKFREEFRAARKLSKNNRKTDNRSLPLAK